MRPALRNAAVVQPTHNLAQRPRFAGFSTNGGGRASNDRFSGTNATFTDVTGAVDGPVLDDGTPATRYGRLTVTTSRSRLGFNLAQNPEDSTPSPTKQLTCRAGQKVQIWVELRSSVAANLGVFVRGCDGTNWIESGAVQLDTSTALTAGVWTWVRGTYTVPAGGTSFALSTWSPAALANGATLEIGRLLVSRSTNPRWGDGNLVDWRWLGPENDSESIGWPFLQVRPFTNLARGPLGISNSINNGTRGLGRFAQDRFTANVTFSTVYGATDGPVLDDGTQVDTYARIVVTSGRSRIGWHHCDPIEGAAPVPARDYTVVPGEVYHVSILARVSADNTVSIFARGSTDGTSWAAAQAAFATTNLVAGTWALISGNYVVPDGITKVSFSTYAPGTLATGAVLEATQLTITRSGVPVPTRDGSSTGWRWVGLPHDSESIGPIPGLAAQPWLPNSALLPWAPPLLAPGYRVVTIDDTAAGRHIQLDPGQDCLLVWPNSVVSDITNVGSYESLVTVYGGRHVVSLGGRITIGQPRVATLATAMATDDTTATVDSTTGFPATGALRIDGESMTYTSKDATHFYGITRRSGFYNNTVVSSQTTHASSASVYISERHRSAVSFAGQSGVVHVEGLHVDGFVCDGIRFSGATGTAQVQNCRLAGVTNYDLTYETDGHPDCIQAYGGGFAEIRLAHLTLAPGPNGNGILNKGSDSGTYVPQWRVRDIEIISPAGTARALMANSDAASAWDIVNLWVRYPPTQLQKSLITSAGAAIILAALKGASYKAGQTDLVPASSVGLGYTSPGYAA